MSDVTARPWKTEERYANIYGSGFRVATANSGEIVRDKANARHIVHCVNNHEMLVAMLRELVETEDDGLFEMLGDDYCERLNELLAALEAEKGGEF